MRIPLTPYGRREMIAITALGLAAALVSAWLWPAARPWPQLILAALWLCLVAFFRDPQRAVPLDDRVLLAPADGRITDITELDTAEFLDGPALRIGIFLSVFDVHINRAPCAARVVYRQHHPGKCLNAMRSEAASAHNESLTLGLDCAPNPPRRLAVKQITGAIARRIVCQAQPQDRLTQGQTYGMIKFGSRTELFVPRAERGQVLVQPGDIVRAGLTPLIRY